MQPRALSCSWPRAPILTDPITTATHRCPSLIEGDTLAALRDMLPSRATALALLEDNVDTTGLNADLADVICCTTAACSTRVIAVWPRSTGRPRGRGAREAEAAGGGARPEKEQEGEVEDEKEGEEEEEEGEGEEGDDDAVEGSGMHSGAHTAKRRRCE
jgi:hypothetical protein